MLEQYKQNLYQRTQSTNSSVMYELWDAKEQIELHLQKWKE